MKLKHLQIKRFIIAELLQESMKKILILILLCSFAMVWIVGCTSTRVDSSGAIQPSSNSRLTPVPTTSKPPDLQLIESRIEPDQYGAYNYVIGTVKNNAGKTYSYVQVTINLYDKSGAQVGSTLANVNNLEPGGIWKFKAPILEQDATTYKIKDITGF